MQFRAPLFILAFVFAALISVYWTSSLAREQQPTGTSSGVLNPEPEVKTVQEKSSVQQKSDLQKKGKDDEDDPDVSLNVFMQQKLEASSRILEGLMIEDYKLIEKNAGVLLKMSRQERWRASNDMMYLQHSNQFRNAVEDLRKKAVSKSTDGSSLAWVNVTMSCIQCHNWVRNIMLADSSDLTEAVR